MLAGVIMDRHGYDCFLPQYRVGNYGVYDLAIFVRMGAHGCVGTDLDAPASPLTEKSPHE